MHIFRSTHNLFQLSITDGWQINFEDNVYTIYNESELDGVIQISAYVNKNNNIYDLTNQYKKELVKHPDATISKLSSYDSIYYVTNNQEEQILQLNWIIGYKKTMLFINLTTDIEQVERAKDLCELAQKLLASLKVN